MRRIVTLVVVVQIVENDYILKAMAVIIVRGVMISSFQGKDAHTYEQAKSW